MGINFIPNELSLYPAVLGAKSFGKETNIQVYVVWVPENSEDIFWSNLLEACEHYVSKKFTNSIVPANVAVEARLTRFLYDYLSSTASKNRVDDFLKNGATYSHQLNVLLPLVVKIDWLPRNARILAR